MSQQRAPGRISSRPRRWTAQLICQSSRWRATASPAEQRALERGVVAGDHREAVEAQDVARLDPARGHRVVGAVGVEAGLEPGPAVHELGVGKARAISRTIACGRAAARPRARGTPTRDRVAAGGAADVGDPRARADQRDLLGGFDHACAHGRRARCRPARARQRRLELGAALQGQVVDLDAEPAAIRDQRPEAR